MLPYHVLPIYGNASLGYYYVNIYIGSPNPQPQSVIVDTGSGILAVPCSNCKQCGHRNHIHPPYDPSKSSSSSILTCVNVLLSRKAQIPCALRNADSSRKQTIVHFRYTMPKGAVSKALW